MAFVLIPMEAIASKLVTLALKYLHSTALIKTNPYWEHKINAGHAKL